MTAISSIAAGDLLQNLLAVSRLKSDRDAIFEAFPHFSDQVPLGDLLKALDNLNVEYTTVRCREYEISSQECPALIMPDAGECYLALARTGQELQVSDSLNPDLRLFRPGRRLCTVIRIDQANAQTGNHPSASVYSAFRELRPILPWLMISSLLTNILGLMAPLLIMAIYDRVIPSGSVNLLIYLIIGVAIIALSDMLFRHARARALAYVGWRGERRLMIALFRKLMSLPLGQVQQADVSQQLSRFRQFESLRDMFTGQVMTTLLDIPFALIFFAVLLYISPQVGVFCLGLAISFAVLGVFTIPHQLHLNMLAAETSGRSQSVVQDAILHQRTIAGLGMQQRWMHRSMPLVESAEEATRRARNFQGATQSLAQFMTSMATVGATVFCAHAAMKGELSFGALIAVIALVSKVLTPVQSLYSGFPQLLAFRISRHQADRVLGLGGEIELGAQRSHQKTMSGAITFSGVTFRPDPLNAPILSQASFHCDAGEVVLIMGGEPAGRAAVLDLIDGLHSPLAGTIEHGGIDIRQIAKDELRKSVTYSTYDKCLFYGTVVQNFRLASSSLSDDEITDALQRLDLLQDRGLLPDGIETRLTESVLANMPEEAIKALTLGRSMARKSSVYLFSEPTNGLSDSHRRQFKTWVSERRGLNTIIVATADRSFMQLADRFVFLNEGHIVVNATGEAGLRKVQAIQNSLKGET